MLDNALSYWKPKACPLANIFGGKKRIEDFIHDFFRHAAAIITNFHAYFLGLAKSMDADFPG